MSAGIVAWLPTEPDAVHCEGVANPRWPLCLEAEARANGFTAGQVRDGQTAVAYEFSEGGFWVVTCHECAELMHA